MLVQVVNVDPERSRPDVYRGLRAALANRGLVPRRRHGRRGDAAANLAIAAGEAWALANPAVAQVYTGTETSVVFRPFTDPPIPLWFALVWQRDDISPVVQRLVAVANALTSR